MPHRLIDGAAAIMDMRNKEWRYNLHLTMKIRK